MHYHHLNFNDTYLNGTNGTTANKEADNANVWAVAASYRFDKNVAVSGLYAQSNDWMGNGASQKAANAEILYKGAQQENKGTWGAWLAYRHMGEQVALFPTYDAVHANEKVWEIGANYTFLKNVVGQIRYANGKQLDHAGSDDGVSTIFGRVEFFF